MADYILWITVHGDDGRPESSRGGVLVDLLPRDLPVRASTQPGRQESILKYAPTALQRLCRTLIAAKYHLRVDFTHFARFASRSPMAVRTTAEVDELVQLLITQCVYPSLYPVSIWVVRPDCAKETARAIDAFLARRMDGALFDAVLSLGGMRIALDMSSITVSCVCADLPAATEWVHQATDGLSVKAEWRPPREPS
jgi:hypothetical protein